MAILCRMGPVTTMVHEAVPVTVPAELLRQLKVKPGDRLEWTVEGSELVVRRVRGVDSLRGCLASTVPFPGLEEEKAAIRGRLVKDQPGGHRAVAGRGADSCLSDEARGMTR